MVEQAYSCKVINPNDEVKVMGDAMIFEEFDDEKMMKNVVADIVKKIVCIDEDCVEDRSIIKPTY